MFTLTACGGFSDLIDKIFDKDDKQVQTDDTNNDDNDNDDDNNDDDDDETPVVYSFATDNWATIAEVSVSGIADTVYGIGDEKNITLSSGEEITLIILGFNHDDLADGSGKAGITIGLKHLSYTTYSINWSALTSATWKSVAMRNERMPLISETLPAELKEQIKTINKKSLTSDGSDVQITEDELFLFSRVELDGTNLDGYADEGNQYEYWIGKTAQDRIKLYNNGTGTATVWWTRTRNITSGETFFGVSSSGSINTMSPTMSLGICYGFCI